MTEIWANFPAASRALSNNIVIEQVKQIANKHFYMLHNTIIKLDKYIIEGQLIEEFVLDHVKELMNCLREANSTLKWLMLHKNCRNPRLREIIEGEGKTKQEREKQIVTLLLHLSKFENQLKNMFTNLVTSKAQIWADDKQKCEENMTEISEYFLGNRNWGKNAVDDNYANWFKNVT